MDGGRGNTSGKTESLNVRHILERFSELTEWKAPEGLKKDSRLACNHILSMPRHTTVYLPAMGTRKWGSTPKFYFRNVQYGGPEFTNCRMLTCICRAISIISINKHNHLYGQHFSKTRRGHVSSPSGPILMNSDYSLRSFMC